MAVEVVNKKSWRKPSLTTQIVIGTVAGIVFGALIGPWAANLKFIGDVWIRMLQMSMVPLVMTAVSMAVGGTEARSVGKMGVLAIKWILTFTLVSCAIGYGLGLLFQPGVGVAIIDPAQITEIPKASSFQDTILSFFSTNIIGSMASGAMVACMVFSILFGLGMSAYTTNSGDTSVINGVKALNACILNIIKIVMKLAPVGVFCLLANAAGTIGFGIIIPMVKFYGAMLVGVIIQFLIYFPLAAMLCRISPLKMPKKFAKMSVVAVTTTSSAISLPTEMEDAVTKFGISRRVVDFVAPIGMSMNSTGAAQCYILVILFLSQASGVALTPMQIGLAVLLSVLMSTGNVGIPGATVVTYTFLAASMGLPLDGIALLLGIDWFVGQLRTVLNVDVDVLIALLVANKTGELDRDVYNEKKVVQYVQ